MAKTEERELWKNRLGPDAIAGLAAQIKEAYPPFEAEGFIAAVLDDEILSLGLKERTRIIAKRLRDYLPTDFGAAIDVLAGTAPHVGGFENWALLTFVELFGLEHFEESVRAMAALTPYSSAEFAIRPFMIHCTERMLPVLHRWAGDPNEHLRRLAAEGSRPRGVWVAHIESFRKDPSPVLELLEKLKADPSLYVRKAVANNLNDISKDHPELIIETARRWQYDRHCHTDWIVRRACRSLIKEGVPAVFPLFGFTEKPAVTCVALPVRPRTIKIGSRATFPFTIVSTGKKEQRLAIDYRLHYVKANGKTSPKVFKLAERTIAPGEALKLAIKQSFADLSTRRHYPGEHRLDIVINGESRAEVVFSVAK